MMIENEEKMTDFQKEWEHLNPYQWEAVLDESPACVINACVGSGKTTVLTAKILYLHGEKQIPLEHMAVLTFTNKAAGEIAGRLCAKEPELTAEELRGFGTFHSVALRLLKERLPVEEAGWTKNFTVMDPDEETDLALDIIAEKGLKVKYKNRLKKRLEQEFRFYLAGNVESRYKDDLFALYPLLETEKKNQDKMTFSDLLRVSIRLLREQKEADVEYGEREQGEKGAVIPEWIIVDEVQDSDSLQMDFLEALKGPETKLFAVGDPNQVIYSWRGTGDNMFFLLKHRFGAKEMSLPVNYRSSGAILEAACRFQQFGSRIEGCRSEGTPIVVKNHYDPFQEAEYLADEIQQIQEAGGEEGGKADYGDIAVLYRLQSQAEILQKVFDRKNIPYELSVKKTLKEIPVLDWLVKVLRFSVNPADEQTGIHVLTDARFGERYTRKKAQTVIRETKKEASGIYRRMAEFQETFSGARTDAENGGVPDGNALFRYFDLQTELHPTAADYEENAGLAVRFLERVCRDCGDPVPESGTEQSRKSFPDAVREFINSSALYGMKMDAGEAEPEESADTEAAEHMKGTDSGRVKLMTLHASKGLEFDTVFLIGMNQGLIPLRCKSFEQEEEERRLFFVGITRAKNRLELSWYTNPAEPGVSPEYSRYLKMIPRNLLVWENVRSEEEKTANLKHLAREVQMNREEKQRQEKEKAPVRVRHRKYGEGVLVSEDEMMIEAEFPGYGRKQFLKAFGEVERIGNSQ